MSYKSTMNVLFICFFCIYSQHAHAQELNITGDTIFINAEAEIQINFPTLPNSFSSVPKNAPYTIKGVDNGVVLIAKAENFKPASLLVSEGRRNHQFIIVFKKDIDYNNVAELVYDYATEKKLEKHIRDQASHKTVETKKTVPVAATATVPQKPVEVTAEKPAENSSNYYVLLEQGDKYLRDQNYQGAKASFKKAHDLRPDDAIPTQRLEEIDMKLAGTEKSVQQENDRKYLSVTTDAKMFLDQKKYEQSLTAYKQALTLRPGDLYATHQIETINKTLSVIKGQEEQQKSRALYKDYILQGEKSLGKNQLPEAKMAFEQALVLSPNDGTALSRLKLIEDKEKVLQQKEEVENNYNAAIQSADKFFKAGDYKGAKTEYNKALGFLKQPWPQDQIKQIDKILIDQAAQEKIENQKLQQRLIAERQHKEKEELEGSYDAAIQSADQFFKKGDYENARIQYNKALDFIKKDWPRDQLVAIDKIVADQIARGNNEKQQKQKQELENKYTAVMESADKLYQAAEYENAKIEYNKALSFIPRPLPQEQIKRINIILAKQSEQANAEKLRLAQEAEVTSKYTAIIKNADLEFDKSNYIKAKKLYTDAAALKPAEEFPKERLNTIDNLFAKMALELKAKNDSLALAKETDRKYNLAISMAKSKYQKGDLAAAKAFYGEAAGLKQLQEEPKGQLEIINKKLADIAREAEINNNYELKIVLADSMLVNKAYDSAILAYNAALSIKPLELYPKSQVKYIQGEMADNEKRKEIKRKEEEEQRYRNTLTRAKKAYNDKNYAEAKSAYNEALFIHPDNKDALRSMDIISYQLEKARADSLSHVVVVKDTVQVKSKKKKKNKPVAEEPKIVAKQDDAIPIDSSLALNAQATPVPYTKEELKNKYPTIDLSVLPPEQPFNQTAVYSKNNLEVYHSILSEKPRLNINYSDQKIKLTCEGISFAEANAYIKIRIQNYSNADFLTGAMMVTWTKQAGNLIKLYPNHLYPSPLPVIKPANEAKVIYSFKSYDILDDEVLNFELIDRFKNIMLKIQIPGSVFNRERARKISQ